MHDCPNCESRFETRHRLRIHYNSTHGERLPNRECARCETEFYSEYEKKYCSEECLSASVSFEGENNPNYRGGKETTECDICDVTFEYYPSEKPGHYCKTCVETETWRHDRDITGSRNPRWSGGEKKLECGECGATFTRHRSVSDSGHVFCSTECQYAWLSEAFAGEGHPNWKGGTEANYGRGWNRVRRQALERDDHECVVCGTGREELGRNPDVHHVVPVRAFVETPATTEADAHYLGNVVSLCPSCHRKAEFGHVPRERLEAAV